MCDFVAQSGGKFLTVEFIKKDGSIRKINGRTGVTKHLKGGKSTIDHSKYVVLFEGATSGYRCINRDTLLSVSCNGLTIRNKSI
jgi:hypothetical protein